jgi:hypothetical protein
MANFNYILTPCDGDVMKNNYVLSSETELTSGDTYEILISETLIGCFKIGEETSNQATEFISYDRNYVDCIDCFTGNSYFMYFENCDNDILNWFDSSNYFSFGDGNTIPTIGLIYYMDIEEESNPVCLKFLYFSIDDSIGDRATDPVIKNTYTTCLDCLPPLSAGTIVEICQVCTDNSGTTTSTFIDAPHPTWTNGNGRSVVQLNMVALGGMNGLNS